MEGIGIVLCGDGFAVMGLRDGIKALRDWAVGVMSGWLGVSVDEDQKEGMEVGRWLCGSGD